jgi:polysaccharide biosynthesis/export protein
MPIPFRLLIALLVCCCAMLPGCARPALSADAVQVADPTVDSGDYRLGVGDKVRVIVFNEETLSGEFAVSAAGTFSFPLIGQVTAFNKTTTEVIQDMQAKLADGYLKDPKVSMEVITYRPYFILGEIKTPGQYPYTNGLTVTNAIATAAGYTPRADRKVVFIRRSGETAERPYRLTPDLRVYPGDTIRLAERFF